MTCTPDVTPPPEPPLGRPLTGLDDEVLADHIRGFASRIAAATCLFLLAIAEYDRRRAWEALECRSMSHWLSWRCGISPVTARQHVRVAAALEDLPRVRDELGAGRLSYSQVRAITRVATPATEEALVDLARVMTAGQLEVVTHAYHRCRAAAEDSARQRRQQRCVTWSTDDDGTIVGSFRLPPEQAALLIKAIDLRCRPDDVANAERDGASNPFGAVRADAIVEMARVDLDHQEIADTADHGDRYLVAVVAETAALRPSGESPERAGPSEPPHQAGSGDDPSDASAAASGPGRPEGLGELCQLVDGPALAPSTVRRLACDQPTVFISEDADGTIVDLGRRTRRPNRALRRALMRRDANACRFPGCPGRGVEAHHVKHWIDGGATRLDNLVSLCRRHHHRHHEGGFRIEINGTGGFRFVRADGHAIPIVPAAPAKPPAGGGLEGYARPDACTPNWEGDRLDLPIIIDGLLRADGLTETEPGPDSQPPPP